MTGVVEPSGAVADEGAGGSAAAWGAVESAGAPAAGFAAFASLCSGALSLFMMVVTRTAFCGRIKIKLNSNWCYNPPQKMQLTVTQHCTVLLYILVQRP